MSMDSISMQSSTLHMSKMDLGSSLRWLSPSTMTLFLFHHFDSTSDPEPQILSQGAVCGYNCLRLLLYAYGQHINVVNHFVYV
jgi:hypothetical protein